MEVGALSAIAAPESFEAALRGLGASVELSRRFIDHHRFSEQEIRVFAARCARRGLDMIVTTEKDAVRFPRRMRLEVPVYLLRVEIEILSGQESWQACIDRICQPGPVLWPYELVDAALLTRPSAAVAYYSRSSHSGSVNANLAPSFSLPSAQIVPPWRWTMR